MRGATRHKGGLPHARRTFQSTLLIRGATSELRGLHHRAEISIHAPHARSDADDVALRTRIEISIHAPHARSDSHALVSTLVVGISIHAPHARSDALVLVDSALATFISIHAPHARSDPMQRAAMSFVRHFNPRSSCEERPLQSLAGAQDAAISIHAPHARSDTDCRNR